MAGAVVFANMLNQLAFRCLILAVVKHIKNVYETATTHFENDYEARTSGEMNAQKYSLFPLLGERGIYRRDCKIQDEKHEKDYCQKDFPKHSKLTPELYLLSCVCKKICVSGKNPLSSF